MSVVKILLMMLIIIMIMILMVQIMILIMIMKIAWHRISAKEGTQVSVVVVLIMMLDTIMITSIDDEHVLTIDCCFEGGDDDHCIVMGDMMSIYTKLACNTKVRKVNTSDSSNTDSNHP